MLAQRQNSCCITENDADENQNIDLVETFHIRPFVTHKIEVSISSANVRRKEAIHYYKSMLTIRKMDLKVKELYDNKIITYPCHYYIGQEACAVGVEAAISHDDDVITSYRCHGWAYTRGIRVSKVLAEVFGRTLGSGHGKGGSMHLYNHNIFGGNAIVGAQVPLGTGIAFAHKYKKDGKICVTCYGDGAANQGQVFEAFNMAKLWKLPVIFVCENNRYGKYTANERASANTDYYTRGDYIPGIKVDGMDVLAVREATKIAKEHALTRGPIILELDTYRFTGHAMNDPGTGYRKAKEIDAMKARDPIKIIRQRMLESNLVSQAEIDLIDEDVKQHIEDSTGKALASPVPDISQLGQNVYVSDKTIYLRGCNVFQKLKHEANV